MTANAPLTFVTNRMIAHALTIEDFDNLYRMFEDPTFSAAFGLRRTREQIQENLQTHIDHWQQYGFGYWAFHDSITGNFIGRGGLKHVIIHGIDEVELGYAIMPHYWKQGFATEMAQACIAIGFEQLKLPTIIAFTITTNKASQRVIGKIGFTYESHFEYANLPHILYRLYNPHMTGN